MENGDAFLRWNAGKLQFLERRCGRGRYPRPMFDLAGCQTTRFADFPVGGVVFELEREEFEGKRVKFFIVGADVKRLILSIARMETPYVVSCKKTLAQARGEL